MKHQYESEILFHLMERDGFNIPSSVPPYESEIKAYLINQVKQAYPKLTDYEAEWLLYNYTKHLPADFPISSATNVTEATFENVVPFAYQSAILKGNTKYRDIDTGDILDTFDETKNLELVSHKTSTLKPAGKNLFNINRGFIETKATYSINGSSLIVTGDWYVRQDNDLMPYTTYTLSYEKAESTNGYTKISVYANNLSVSLGTSNTNELTFTTPSSFNNISVVFYAEEGRSKNTVTYTNIQLEKGSVATSYEPYKSSFLTITGKNLFDGELEIGGLSNVNGLPVDNQPDRCRSINYTKVNSSTDYVISHNHSGVVGIREFDEDYKLVSWSSLSKANTFTTTNKTKYIKFIIINTNVDNLVQVEEGTTATPYEPYKANILSTSEEVELRGVGEVKDTVDCLTGELTQRIGEIVLDGSEEWKTDINGVGVRRYVLKNIGDDLNNDGTNTSAILCDKFKASGNTWVETNDAIQIVKSSGIYIIDSSVDSLDAFVNKLKAANIKIQYQLATESVKTVELKTVNESGESVHFMPLEGTMHVQSSGEIIQPTFDMSVPVEATTQNLASFIDLEMEE